MSESRPPRRRVAGERARARRAGPALPATEPDGTTQPGTAPAAGPTQAPGAAPPPPPVDLRKRQGAERSADSAPPAVAGEGGTDGRPGEAPRRTPRLDLGWPALALAVLSLLLVAALAVTGVLLLRVREAEGVTDARREALAAARDHARSVLSYDHRTLDRDFARAERALTGAFKRDYARTTSTVVRPSAEQYDVVVEAQVAAGSVVRAEDGRVVTLLYVNQTTTSTRLEGPEVDLNRVRMTLVERDGKWLVSALAAL